MACLKFNGRWVERAMLRPGNVHSADRWKKLLEPAIRRYENKRIRKYFRRDAAFAKPEIYEYLEEKYVLNWTRLSCKHFLSIQVRLGLFVLAYNLDSVLLKLVLPRKIKHWSLRSLLVKLIKIGAKVIRHSKSVTFQMMEVTISREILFRINRLPCCSD